MSAILENAGRGITSAFTPSASQPSEAQQRDRGNALLTNMSAGGAMLGGGTAAVVAALGLLNSLRKEREMEDDARLDDNTLYISDPHKKRVKSAADGVSPLLAPGLAITGSIAGAGAGYALVQGIFNAAEKRRRRALLDEAQRETIAAADLEVAKSAAAESAPKFNLTDLLTASPVALPLLTMLATGGLTYAALNKSFPVTGPPKKVGPKRIRVGRDAAPYQLPEEDAEVAKVASVAQHSDLSDAGDEFLASFVAASRKGTVTNDLICKAASGELEAMENLLKCAGVDALLASLKGASEVEIPQDRRMLGTMALFKSATLRDTARAIAAAEYLEIHGGTFAETCGCQETMAKMASLGCLMGMISRDSALPELAKQAGALPVTGETAGGGLLAMLKAMLSGSGPVQPAATPAVGGDNAQREDRDAALTSDAGGGLGGVAEDGSDGAQASEESTGDNDVIDDVMASTAPGDVLVPSS